MRSPRVAVTTINNASKGKTHFSIPVLKNRNTILTTKQLSAPPQNPSQVFLGEMEGKSKVFPQTFSEQISKTVIGPDEHKHAKG